MLPEECFPVEAQPHPAADPQLHPSKDTDRFKKPQHDLQKPTCPQCGLTEPEHRLPLDSLSSVQLKSSKSSMSSSQSSDQNRSNRNGPGSNQTAGAPRGSCFQLLLACLWCQCSVLLLGLLEASSCCLQGLCSSCCCCCSDVQDVSVEDLSCRSQCHSVLSEACCEPTECLEFCLDCCEICHRS
ncbi:myoD family inhibitor domain-containing protein [Austrofundulus limnaeus]|uniref:MyoD family inhibitor domain-containing protein n=1 Tax=Austrofundulus limnaeus TaxID=52670 RepID=A0A2I4B6X6_AUSLI|nr:PREDICTED: myoD family inhibitor domain-containing protein [Austrofundulus limnaeus]